MASEAGKRERRPLEEVVGGKSGCDTHDSWTLRTAESDFGKSRPAKESRVSIPDSDASEGEGFALFYSSMVHDEGL